MLQYYVARVLSYLVARMAIPTIWWFWPKSLLPIIEFNGWWMRMGLDYLVASAPKQVGTIARFILVFTDKVGTLIQWTLRWYVSPDVKDHVEVLAKAFFTPGGWLMVAQLTFVIFLVTRLTQVIRRRRRASRVRRAAYKEKVLPVQMEAPTRLPSAPQLAIPPR